MGRSAGIAAAFRRIRGARLQDRDHAADGAGAAVASTPRCRKIRFPTGGALQHPQASARHPAAGRHRGAVAEAAKLLVAAENPVHRRGPAGRTPAGVDHLVELAELLQCRGDRCGRPDEFPDPPSAEPDQPRRRGTAQADVILGLESGDFWGVMHAFRDHIEFARGRPPSRAPRSSASARAISSSNPTTRTSSASGPSISPSPPMREATLPSLIEAVKRLIDAGRKSAFEARGKKLRHAHRRRWSGRGPMPPLAGMRARSRTARLSAELFDQIKNEDWSLVSTSIRRQHGRSGCGTSTILSLHRRIRRQRHRLRAPAAVGAALANKKHGRLTVTHPAATAI